MSDEERPDRVDFWLLSDRAIVIDDGHWSERGVSIGVADARIAVVRPAEELRSGQRKDEATRRGERIIDVGSAPVVPTFVNGHSHLAMAPLRGVTSWAKRSGNVVSDVFFAVEKHLRPGDVRVFTRLGAFESLLCGVGEVWDHYYFGEAVAEGLAEAGLTGHVAPTLQDVSGPGKGTSDAALRATLAIDGNSALKRRGISAALGPHATDTVSDALFKDVLDLANNHRLPVHMHLVQSIEEVRAGLSRFDRGAARGALDLLSTDRVLVAHGLYLSDAECAELSSAGWVLGYCPNSQLQFGVLSPVGGWLKAAGKITLGTDCVASNDALDVQRELPILAGEAGLSASFASVRKALSASGRSPERVEIARKRRLQGMTISEPPSLLHIAWGTTLDELRGAPAGITPGALANFLVLDPDDPSLFPGDDLLRSLAYGATSGAISLAVVGGQIRGEGGGLRAEILESELYRETLSEARRRRGELLERAKRT